MSSAHVNGESSPTFARNLQNAFIPSNRRLCQQQR